LRLEKKAWFDVIHKRRKTKVLQKQNHNYTSPYSISTNFSNKPRKRQESVQLREVLLGENGRWKKIKRTCLMFLGLLNFPDSFVKVVLNDVVSVVSDSEHSSLCAHVSQISPVESFSQLNNGFVVLNPRRTRRKEFYVLVAHHAEVECFGCTDLFPPAFELGWRGS
jgi:hypothetical protein